MSDESPVSASSDQSGRGRISVISDSKKKGRCFCRPSHPEWLDQGYNRGRGGINGGERSDVHGILVVCRSELEVRKIRLEDGLEEGRGGIIE